VALPDELNVVAGLIHAPDGSGTKLAGIVACHCGPLNVAESALRPLKQFGTALMDAIGTMPYCELNGMLDAAYPKGALHYWKSNFFSQLSDGAIDTMVECFARCPSSMAQLLIEHVHGAATRIGVSDTAFPHRQEGYNFLTLGQWSEHRDTDRCVRWVRDTYQSMKPFVGSGRYVNYLGDDEPGDSVAAAYGPNYRRLQELKTKFDPSNIFHTNQNIRPLM
jgi:hypothetical protein